MKLLLLLLVSCLALHNGKGAPKTAVYKYLRCNPEGNRSNCVVMQSPKMAWSPELPAKLPAETAQHLEAEPVEDEEEEDDMPVVSEEGESPLSDFVQSDEGSGLYEGSGFDGPLLADRAFEPAESETGSGEALSEKDNRYKGREARAARRLFPRSLNEAKPAERELRDDHLLQL